MYIIRKEFPFEAGHHLEGLPEGHLCSQRHGHSYLVTVELRSQTLNEIGMVQDYGELKSIKSFIDEGFDHKYLNNILPFNLDDDLGPKGESEPRMNPTAENMAKHFYDLFKPSFPKLCAVEVKETAKTCARYEA